jgi:hypothetical protein
LKADEMTLTSGASDAKAMAKIRNVFFVAVGIALLLLKRHYTGPLQEIVNAYLGNVSASFALYFVCMNLQLRPAVQRVVAVSLTLAAVELFEAFNGFGFMSNTYDPVDFAANALGVLCAFAVDVLIGRNRGDDRNTEPGA